MLRLKRYIVTEIIEVFLAVIVIVMLIMTSFQFAKLLSEAASGNIAGDAIYQLLALQSINLFVLLAPFAFFIAILLALSRLATNNELIAMKSIGYSDYKIYQSIFFFAIPLSLGLLLVSFYVLPKVVGLNEDLTKKAQKESELSIIQPGKFRTIADGVTLFAANVNGSEFSKFFMWKKINNGEAIITAENGEMIEIEGTRHIYLYSGSRYSHFNDEKSQLIGFGMLEMLLPSLRSSNQKGELKATPTKELIKNKTLPGRIELQARTSSALSVLLLAFLAPLLVQFNPRTPSNGRFVIAILAYAIYSNSQHIVRSLVEDEKLPLVPGMYITHVIFLIIVSTWLLFKNNGIKIRGNSYAKKT